MLARFQIILISFSLSGCFYMPVVSKGKVSTLDEAPRLATPVSSIEGKSIAAYDPASKVATTIPAPSGALSGSSVTLPAGALAIAAELVVEEAVPLSQTSVASSLSLSSDITIRPIGSGLIIRPTENMDLTQPLTISMPIDPTAGLRGWLVKNLALNNAKHYTVFYKYLLNGELKAGAMASSELRFSDTGSVLFDGYFGAYWLAEVSTPILESVQVATSEPIVNKDNVSVVTSTGIVTETEVVAKASIPQVEWLKVSLDLDTAQRTVKVVATISAGRTLSSCQVDLFEKTDASGGLNITVDSSLTALHKISKVEAHTLFARFRCLDDQARQTISPWSAAVSVPGAAPTPVAQSGTDFCASPAPELRMITTIANAATTNVTQTFTALGGCVYTADLDAIWGAGFGINTADGATRCVATQGTQIGEQVLNCFPSTDQSPSFWLPQGNYTIKLDFSASGAAPKMSIGLQSCALGDFYLLTTHDSNAWPAPDSMNRMTHLGGCQYAAESSKTSDATLYVRIQNLNGDYSCGDGTTLPSHTQQSISCGATPSYYTQNAYNPFLAGFKYILNLGTNRGQNGETTSTPYVLAMEVDKCSENRYLLGPTTAGNNRQMGVNHFNKTSSSCTFNYSWVQSGASFTPFFIGLGEGAEKCGVVPATGLTASVWLDCSASAVAIDMTSFVNPNGVYRLNLQTDSVTGKPSYIDIQPLNTICMEPLYAVKNATAGFRPDIQTALTEISECIYQYDWTPTAASRTLSFMHGNNPGTRCAKFPGYSNPTVGGPATDFGCGTNYSGASIDYPFAPAGVVDGMRYKINLDFRLGHDRPKISVAAHTPTSCPDLYVLGLSGLPNTPAGSNQMTRNGDCNYSFKFKTPPAATFAYIRIADVNQVMECGRDSSTGYYDPYTSGQTAGMACSDIAAPADYYLSLGGESHYQISVHYDSSGASRISLAQIHQTCPSSPFTFAGPASLDQNAAYTKTFQSVDSCVEEMIWAPTTTSNAFLLQSNYYGYSSYCGLASGPQASLNGAPASAICHIFNVTQASPFSAAEGISPANKYLVRLDRSVSPFEAPQISIKTVNHVYANTLGTYVSGSTSINNLNTTAEPGGRRNAASWAPPGSPYRYMFGGLGYSDTTGPDYLADFWRYDMDNDSWTLLPAADYGTRNGVAGTPGAFGAAYRPSARQGAVTIYDPSGSGKLWLFGGEGINGSGAPGYLNDLWLYDFAQNQWALMSETFTGLNMNGTAATFGMAAHSNFPGSRRDAEGWVDASGKLYIFGGYGFPDSSTGSPGVSGRLNDLWVFDPSNSYANSTWAWVGGTNQLYHAGSNTWPAAREGHNGWKAANGHFWLFGGHGAVLNTINGTEGRLNDLWSYNPVTNIWTRRGGSDIASAPMTLGLRGVNSSRIWPASRYHAASWQTPDGKFWFMGGEGLTGRYMGGGLLSDVWNFDPTTMEWTWVSGFTQYAGGFEMPAVNSMGTYGAMGSPGNNYPGSRFQSLAWPDNTGNVFIMSGYGNAMSSGGDLNDLWYLDF